MVTRMLVCLFLYLILGSFVANRPYDEVIIQARTSNGNIYGSFLSDSEILAPRQCFREEVSYVTKYFMTYRISKLNMCHNMLQYACVHVVVRLILI